MAAMLEMLNPNSEVDPKGVLETATNFISTTLRTLIFSPSSPPGYASENDNKLNLISLSEVALHDQIDDCWIVIYDRVYDITSFFDQVSKFESDNEFFVLIIIRMTCPEPTLSPRFN